MRAIVIREYGGPEVLRLTETEAPSPGPGEVLVDVGARGVNFIDVYQRSGAYQVSLPYVPGMEAAGTVAALGEGVSGFEVGQRVGWAMAPGGYADQAVVRASLLVPVPDAVSTEQAAALLLQGMTAHYLTHSVHPVAEGETVLVHAAAGGTGLLLTQLAKARGARVIGTVSTGAKERIAREAGAVVIAPVFERRAAGVYHNTVAVLDADGGLRGLYRKMHIPDDPLYYEKFYFTPGDLGFRAFDTRVGRIGTLVCWDQWYPEGARLTALQGASILFYPTAIGWHPAEKAQYGAQQLDAWRTIQRGHAIANGVFVAAVNRVGREDGIRFWGQSFVADPYVGERLAGLEPGALYRYALDGEVVGVSRIREKVPVTEYLKLQKRYAHLFGDPPRTDVIEAIQERADRNIERFRRALVGNVDHVDARHDLEHLAVDVSAAADTRRTEIELAGFGLGQRDKLFHRLDTERRPHDEQVRVPRVLPHDVDPAGSRQVAGHRLPRPAEVGRDEEIRREIVMAVPIERHVRRAGVVARRLDPAHVGPLRHAGDTIDGVRPRQAAVARHLHVAVIGARPDHARRNGRFCEGGDRAPCRDAVIAGKDVG